MAEYALRMLLEKERPGKAEVSSAGIAAADSFPATVYAIEAPKIWDLDVSPHKSRLLTREMVDAADLILVMSPEHHKAVLRLNKTAADKTFLFKSFPDNSPMGEAVEDPVGQSLDRYNECFLELGEYLGKHLPEIVQRIDQKLND